MSSSAKNRSAFLAGSFVKKYVLSLYAHILKKDREYNIRKIISQVFAALHMNSLCDKVM
jgi:hypothetical protein